MSHKAQSRNGGQLIAWSLIPVVVIVVIACLFVGAGDLSADRSAYWGFQRNLFLSLNHLLDAWPASFWWNLTTLGDGLVLLTLLSPLLVWRPWAWVALVASAPIASVLSLAGKDLLAVPRPAAVLDLPQFTVIGHAMTARNSLPSGHAITVFAAAAALLATLAPRPRSHGAWLFWLVCLLVAVVVGLSRVAVGGHWPLDVLAGAAGGWLAGISGAALVRRWPGRWWSCEGSAGRLLLGVMLFGSSLHLAYRALEYPIEDLTLWLSALLGMIVAGRLLVEYRHRPNTPARANTVISE